MKLSGRQKDKKSSTFLTKYIRYSLLAFLVFGLLLGGVLSLTLSKNMRSRARDITAQFVRDEVLSRFTPEDLALPAIDTDTYQEIQDKINTLSLGTQITRIKIWNSDRILVWSDNRGPIGNRATDEDHLAKALGGKVVSELTSASELQRKYPGENIPTKLLELYIPINFPATAGIDGVFELYQDISPLYEDIRFHNLLIWLSILFGLCILYLLLLGFVSKTSRQLEKQKQALQLSEEKYRTLVQGAQDSIITVDNSLKILFANSAAAELFGYAVGEIPGQSLLELVDEADRPLLREGIRTMFKLHHSAKKGWKNKTITGRRKDNRTMPVEITLSYSGKSDKAMVTGFFRDVTKRRNMEIMLLQATQEWEDTFNTINDAITIHDNQFNIIRINQAAEELLGLDPDKILAQKCFESYHGSNCPPDGCPSCQTLQNGKPSMTEIYEPHLQKHLEIKALARFDSAGAIIGVVHIVRDISSRKEAEERIKKAYVMAHDIIEHSPFGIYVVNKDLKIEYVNQAMLQISGSRIEDFIDTRITDIPGYIKIGMDQLIEKALTGQPFFLGDILYTPRNSTKETVRNFTGIPLEEADEPKALIFVEDITARRKAEEQQEKLEAQLIQAQKMESVGRLAGGVAHDFNNILTAIMGYTELVLNEIDPATPMWSDLYIIKESAEKAAALTRQLLAFSRKQVLEMRAVDLNSIINNMSKMLTRLIGEDVQLEFKSTPPLGNIMADPGQLEQVIMNLAVNARDAMPQGGTMLIETGTVDISPDATQHDQASRPGPHVVMTITDSGIGMPPELIDNIFEPFFTTKESGRGTGLGLAMVYGIIKQHQGFITVDSEEGRGTTFRIFLPVTDETTEISGAAGPLLMPGGSETILIAEDEEKIRTLLSDILQPLGYKLLLAADGEEALDLAAANRDTIDLVLTDVIMPKMSGRDLANNIAPMIPDVKIIYMSGYTDDIIAQHGVLEPGTIFIQKPVTPSKITGLIRKVLDDA